MNCRFGFDYEAMRTHLILYVADRARSISFYRAVPGLAPSNLAGGLKFSHAAALTHTS